MSLVLLFLGLYASVSRAAVITSQVNSVIDLNGVSQGMQTITVDFGPSDEGVPFDIQVSNSQTQTTSNLQFVSQAPSYVYTHQLIGWVPRTIYPYEVSACISPTPPTNSSSLTNPSVLNANVDSGSPFATVQTFVSRSTKRLRTYGESHRELPPSFRPRRSVNSQNSQRAQRTHRRLAQKTIHKQTPPPSRGLARTQHNGLHAVSRLSSSGPNSVTGWLNDVACNSFIGEIFGTCGSGGLQDLINAVGALQTEVTQQQTEITSISNTVQLQQQWQNQEQQTTNLLIQADSVISSQVNSLLQDAQTNAQDIQALSQVTFSFISQVDSSFQQVAQQISGLSTAELALYNYTNALQNVSQQQINNLVSSDSALSVALMQTIMMQYAMYAQTQTRRSLIALLWSNVVNAITPIPSCMFVQCLGAPFLPLNGTPMVFGNAANCPADAASCSYLKNRVPTTNLLNTAQNPPTPQNQQDLHNLYSAGMLSMVRLQYTDSSSRIAYERQISYSCDKLFLLNNYIPNVNFQYLLRFVGPPSNGSSYCYDPTNPGTATWDCNCVVVETYTSCALLTGSPVFPFGWDQTRTLQNSAQVPQFCQNGVVQASSLSGENLGITAAIESTGMLFTSTSNVYSFFTALCQASSSWAADANGNIVRVASDTSTGFIDLSLNPNLLADVCESDVSVLANLPNNQYRLSYNIYSAWGLGYQAVSTALLGFWDEQVFGTLPTGTSAHKIPFNQRPDIQQSVSCTNMYVSKYAGTGIQLAVPYTTTLQNDGINPNPNLLNPNLVTNGDEYPPYPDFLYSSTASMSTEKLPVYSIAPVERVYNPELSVNGGSCVIVNGTCSLPMNGLNFSASVALTLSTEWSSLLPGPTYWVGDFNLGYNSGGNQVVVDVPRDLLKVAKTRKSICGSLLYLFQPRSSIYTNNSQFNIPDTDYGVPVNALDWASFYNSFYDPNCATESPYSYARVVDQYGICQQSVSDTGAVTQVVPGDNDYCALMQAFRVYVPNYVSAYMSMEPRQYTGTATFVVPVGEIIQQTNSACPSSYTVSMPNGAAAALYITFFTTTASEQTATLTVTGYGSCAGTQSTTFTFSATNSYTTSPIAACGSQYANVYPYLSNIPCYSSPGIELYKAYSSQDGPIVSSSTVDFVSTQVDSAVTSMSSMINQLLALQTQITSIPYLATSAYDAAQQYAQVMDQQLALVASANYTQQNAAEAAQKRIVQQQISQNSATVLGNIVLQEQQVKKLQNITQQANASNALAQLYNQFSQNATAQMAQLINITGQEIAAEAAYVRHELALAEASLGGGGGGSCGGTLGSIFLIGSIICGIENAFSGLLSGIMSVIMIIIIIGVCICCLPTCVNAAKDSIGKIRSHKTKSTSNTETSGKFELMVNTDQQKKKKKKKKKMTITASQLHPILKRNEVLDV